MYPVLNADVDWWDFDIDGKALAAAAERLEKIAKKRKVKGLFDFFSMTREDAIADVLGGDPDDPSTFDEAEVPPEQWFDPAEGLETVHALLDYVRNDGRKIKDPERVAEDLKVFESVLSRAAKEDLKWYLAQDI
jgi:hypothetical protein